MVLGSSGIYFIHTGAHFPHREISKRKWNFVQVNVTPEEVKKNQENILSLIYPNDTVMDITIGMNSM